MNTAKDLKLKKIYRATVIAFVISLLAQIYVSNIQALKGKDLVLAQTQREHLLKEIARLEYDKSSVFSLSKVEERAKTLGFVAFVGDVSVVKTSSFAAAFPVNQ